MYCVRNVTEDLYWVGANDHRLALFENIHPIPRGVSYNAYLLLDEQITVMSVIGAVLITVGVIVALKKPKEAV